MTPEIQNHFAPLKQPVRTKFTPEATSFTVDPNEYGFNLQNTAPQAWATIGTSCQANVNLQIQ
jgi:hypothetical protein